MLARPSVYPGGGVYPFGDAEVGAPKVASVNGAGPTFNSLVVDMVATNDGTGYWLASADGGVYNYGTAQYYGSLGNLTLQGPIVGMAATPDDRGYWLIGFDGGIFAFGDARFYGSMGGSHLNLPIVGMAATPDGGGYWMVADDGGIFAFGDARFYGSTGSMTLAANIVAMAPTPDGGGYWLVGADGGIFAFGDAGYFGSMGGKPLNDGILSMAPTPDGQGYWLVAWDGGVFTFGDATYAGSLGGGGPAAPVTKLVPTPDGDGYWLLGPDAFNYSFDNPPPNGTFPGSAAIVAAAESQVQPDPSGGGFCNPYGPCEEWCALFATWAMEQGGVGIPSYAFTGDIYDWGAANGTVLPPSAVPVPGDDLLYGYRAGQHRHVAAHRDRGPGLAGRGHHHHRGGRRAGDRREPRRDHQRALPAGRLGLVQRLRHLRLRPALRAAAPARWVPVIFLGTESVSGVTTVDVGTTAGTDVTGDLSTSLTATPRRVRDAVCYGHHHWGHFDGARQLHLQHADQSARADAEFEGPVPAIAGSHPVPAGPAGPSCVHKAVSTHGPGGGATVAPARVVSGRVRTHHSESVAHGCHGWLRPRSSPSRFRSIRRGRVSRQLVDDRMASILRCATACASVRIEHTDGPRGRIGQESHLKGPVGSLEALEDFQESVVLVEQQALVILSLLMPQIMGEPGDG